MSCKDTCAFPQYRSDCSYDAGGSHQTHRRLQHKHCLYLSPQSQVIYEEDNHSEAEEAYLTLITHAEFAMHDDNNHAANPTCVVKEVDPIYWAKPNAQIQMILGGLLTHLINFIEHPDLWQGRL